MTTRTKKEPEDLIYEVSPGGPPLELDIIVDGQLRRARVYANCWGDGGDGGEEHPDDRQGPTRSMDAFVLVEPTNFEPATPGHISKIQADLVERVGEEELIGIGDLASSTHYLAVKLTGGVHPLSDLEVVLNRAREHQLPIVIEFGEYGRIEH